MKLLTLLKSRFTTAEKFSKDFHSEVKRCVKDYKADTSASASLLNIDYVETVQRRYQFVSPLIFTNHEGMLASMFDRPPDLIFSGRGKDDNEKEEKVKAAYDYLVDKLDLESFMTESAWWFILVGFASAHCSYDKRTEEVPEYNEETGEQALDVYEKPVFRTVFKYDDPTVFVGNPGKEFYSPESEFTIKADKVPYYFIEDLMSVEAVKDKWKKTVEPDATLEVSGIDKNKKEKNIDVERVKIKKYFGTIPAQNKGEVDEWEYNAVYSVVYTEKKILFKDKLPERLVRLVKWYGPPNEFFGFGVAKVLRQFQKEKSIRRGQQIRYADVAAYPKLALKADKKIDIKAWQDPRENVVALYEEEPPQYISPPDLSNVLTLTEQSADRDAQQASGMLDLSQGAQSSSTVKTATGQTIFAEAAERRMRLAKKKFTKFYKQTVVLLLKLAQENWDSEKLVNITDSEGAAKQISVSADDLSDVDFDTDIDIDAESLNVNKDVLRQQSIELYDKVKDDPVINRRIVFKDMIREGFNKKDPERYIKEMNVEAGMVLVDPQTGQQFMVDESGELVSQEEEQQLSTPQGGAKDVPASQPGVLGGIYK